MLAPDDRAVLREQLRPDPGFELDLAVATTFTLDLTAALVAPLAFAAFDIGGTTDPVAVLEAVRAATEKVTIFCQVGQVRVPAVPSDLMAFLEPMVHEVRPANAGYLFHPKVWVLRYQSDDHEAYRLLCGTRNLTDDVSWDALVRLDGVPGTRRDAGNGPLVEFVHRLPELVTGTIDPGRRLAIDDLAEDLRSVVWEAPKGVKAVTFHALGLQRRRRTPLVDAMGGHHHLVVSPFLDDDGVLAPTVGSQEVTVVSRVEALEQLDPATIEQLTTCHVLSPMAGLSEPDEDDVETSAHGLLGGLHAKAYVVESGNQARLFLGSSNATSAGLMENNVEFVVELQAGRRDLGIDRFVGPDAPFATLLSTYEPTGGRAPSEEDELERELAKHLRRLADQPFTATVVESAGGWTEAVSSTKPLDVIEGHELRVGLLTLPGSGVVQHGASIAATFDGLAKADLTPFVVLRLSAQAGTTRVEQGTVVRATLVGDPDDRLDEVLARQVDTPEKFLRFLALLLGLHEGPPTPVQQADGDGATWTFGSFAGQGVFEMLVRALGERPQAIADLDRLVARLETTETGRAILPAGFSELWATVLAAHDVLRART